MKIEENWVDKFLETFTMGVWMFIFAATLYLYLVVRAIALAPLPDPKPLSWGDTQTLDILFNHMLRKQYGMGGSGDLNNFWGQVLTLCNTTIKQFHIVNIVIAGFGVVYLFLKEKIWGLYLVIALLISYFSLIKFTNFEIDPRTLSTMEQYFLQLHMIIAIFIGFGFQLLIDLSQKLMGRKKQAPEEHQT